MALVKPADIQSHVGSETGVSDWIEIDQSRVNTFADVTDDHQFIHIDPERALAETPFGGTIAHGFLTLSLAARMAADVAFGFETTVMGINYGFDKIRFLQPVRVGKRIRGRFVLTEATERKPGQWLLRQNLTVEIEGEDKPALIADWLALQITG
jgi:acyl dehydratase